MQQLTINSKWLNSFNIWSAEFFNLLDKAEYEKILNTSKEDLKARLRKIDLTQEEFKKIQEKLKLIHNSFGWFNLNFLKDDDNIYRNYVFIVSGLKLHKAYLEGKEEEFKKEMKRNKETLEVLE